MKNKKLLTAITLTGVVLVSSAIFATSALAASDNESGFNVFGRVAQILGIDESKLDDAFKTAREERIDYLVEEGRISEEEADRRKEMIENGDMGFGFRGKMAERGNALRRSGRVMMEDLADYLEIDEDELIDEIHDGKSIEDIVSENGKNIEQVKSYLIQKGREKIDELEADGKITQNQADFLKDRLETRVDMFLSSDRLGMGLGRFDR